MQYESTGSGVQSIESKPRSDSPQTTSIHILDDHSLLTIFYLYRPVQVLVDGDQGYYFSTLESGKWIRERWWYRLAHVCRRWRDIIFGSASYLGLCLVCTHGTPVADMLAHSPPLLLDIDYLDGHEITPEDEEGILLALQQCDRVRRIRLEVPTLILQRFLVVMDKEFPMLEYLFIAPTSTLNSDMCLVLPETFQAPHLRHFILADFTFSIKSPLLSNTMGLVTLSLVGLHSPSYFHPNDLFQRLSMMPYLETLMIDFHSPVSHRDIKKQLRSRPITTDIILPSLRWFSFWGTSDYLEAILPSIVTPFLEKLDISFFNQLTFSIPRLQHFLTTMEAHRFNSATLVFEEEVVYMIVYPRRLGKETLSIQVRCRHYDWQVASMVQITDALVAVSSVVEHLTLNYKRDSISSERHNESDRTLWHYLLRSFGNVKTLRVARGLVKELSHTLRPEDGEPLMELLPELKALEYSAADEADDAFSAFATVRENIGWPLSLNPCMNTPQSATQPYAVVPGIQKNSSENGL